MSDAFSWNLVTDWQELVGQSFTRHALLAGTIAAIVCAAVGYFVVLRGLTFAADALTHVGFAGAAGAVLAGVSAVSGLLTLTVVTAAAIGVLDIRVRGRDVAIGLVLVGALGLGVAFLRLSSGYSNETYVLLFGSILFVSVGDLLVLGIAGIVALTALVVIYRPLLFASLDSEIAESRGVNIRGLSVAFLLVVAVATAAAVQVIGALLAVALIVAPAASAQRLIRRPGAAIAVAIALGLGITWAGIALGFWLKYPVSFFITSLAAIVYGMSRIVSAWIGAADGRSTSHRDAALAA